MKESCENGATRIAEPECYVDIAVDYFSNIKTEIAIAETVNSVTCLLNRAKKFRDKCSKAPFTKYFVDNAFKEVSEAAGTRMKSINTFQPIQQLPNTINPILHFSSGRRSNSTLEALQKALDEEENKRSGFGWV